MSTNRYMIANFDGFEAVVEVDTDLLSVETATEINGFWGDADRRLRRQDGDVVLAVARLFGARCIAALAAEGTDSASGTAAALYAKQVLDDEGWPGSEWKGLQLISADAPVPGYDDLSLSPIESSAGGRP